MKSVAVLFTLVVAIATAAPTTDPGCNVQYDHPDGSPANSDGSSSLDSTDGAGGSAVSSASTTSATSHATVSAAAAVGTAPSAPGAGFSDPVCNAGPLAPVGIASFPINGNNLCAPTPTDPVPANAAIYTPPAGTAFNTTLFANWANEIGYKNDSVDKWLKIAPGLYSYDLGKPHPAGADSNQYAGTNIGFYNWTGGWTLDIRGCTFVIPITPDNDNQRPLEMISIAWSDGFTILGGTVWTDVGPMWSYARMSSLDSNGRGTFQVSEGYNRSVWRSAGKNIYCVDDSNPKHYSRPDCGPWSSATWDFSNLDSAGTFTATVKGASLNTHFIMSIPLGWPFQHVAVGSDLNPDFTVKGMTTNDAFYNTGLDPTMKSATYIDCWTVSPPPRPGFAPEVQGPVWGRPLLGYANWHEDGEQDPTYQNSWWQTTGSVYDVQDMANQATSS